MIRGAHVSSKVLFCVTGLTPQIVTETLYALCTTQAQSWVPDRVCVLTTVEGKNRIMSQLLASNNGQFDAFCQDYGLSNCITFDKSCITLVRDSAGQALDDVRTPDDNLRLGDAISHTIQSLVAQYDEVHVSIAGGRKTMGFYAGSALSLFGRPQDRMSHVLVNEPFEQAPHFYFPPKVPRDVLLRDGVTRVLSSSAVICLADMPFLRLGGLLRKDAVPANIGFEAMVAQLQSSIQVVWLSVEFETRTVHTPHGSIVMTPSRFAVFCWFAMVKKFGLGEGGGLCNTNELYQAYFYAFASNIIPNASGKNKSLAVIRAGLGNIDSLRDFLDTQCSHIRKAFQTQFGAMHAAAYDIKPSRKNARKQPLRELIIDAQYITLPAQLDWVVLQTELAKELQNEAGRRIERRNQPA